MMVNGKLRVSADELALFAARADAQPVAQHLWLLNKSTGEAKVERRADYWNVPAGWALVMTGPDPVWLEQWHGDWQRACDEQLNPLIEESLRGGV